MAPTAAPWSADRSSRTLSACFRPLGTSRIATSLPRCWTEPQANYCYLGRADSSFKEMQKKDTHF